MEHIELAKQLTLAANTKEGALLLLEFLSDDADISKLDELAEVSGLIMKAMLMGASTKAEIKAYLMEA